MAAALIRRGTGLYCVHRELCRVVWRSQTALFSSKPSDRKQPRRTHIKKAKAQPAVDVAKLLEEIFSQRRPGTAPPAGKARPAKASSTPTKPPTTSSMNVPTSNVPPLSKTDARSLSNVTVPLTSGSSPTSTTPAAIEHQPVAETTETKVETAPVLPLSAHMVEKNAEASSFPAATVEPSIETTVESAVEPILPPVETVEDRAAVVEHPVETTVEAPAEAIQTKVTDSGVVNVSYTAEEASLIETTIHATVEDSTCTLETPKRRAAVVEGPVEPTVDATAQVVETSSAGPVNLLHIAEEEPSIETSIDATVETSTSPLETLESRAVVAEGSVETTIEAGADRAAQAVETNLSHTAKEETTIESPIETSHFPLETLETRAAAVEGPVEHMIDVTVDAAAQEVETSSTDSGPVNLSHTAKEEPLMETTIESAVSEGTAEMALTQNAQESSPLPLENKSTIESTVESCSVKEEVSRSEEMTLESVTLHVDQVLVASLKTDELLRTKSILDEEVEKQLQELLVQTEIRAVAETQDSSEDESKNLNEVLSKWDSLSEDLQELEGESGALVKELLCHVPAAFSKTPATVKTRSDGEQMEEKATETMTLESVTLAEVKAEIFCLETEVLLEAREALEKEADVQVKEEKMEVTTTIEDIAEFQDDILTLDSISEATDAIEAVMLEIMLGSEQEPRQLLDGQDAEGESREQQGDVLEAMSLESVTLAEVEASFGTLEDESLSETTDYLEKEAEIIAGENRMEVEEVVVSEEMTVALQTESLPEDLQIDALMEELIFSIPGHITGPTDGQEVVRADVLDETAAVGSVNVGSVNVGSVNVATAAAASPAKEEQGQEGAQAEALGNEEGKGTHADLDPVQRLFLEKIREYNNMRRMNGGLLEAEPGYEKYLSEETAKLQRLYGGGDLSSFPQFTFTEPKMDQDSK